MTVPTAAQRELLDDVREFSVGPIQLLIGGVLFDVKELTKPSDARLILREGEDDYVEEATLQDGRQISFRVSAVQAVIDGSAWA